MDNSYETFKKMFRENLERRLGNNYIVNFGGPDMDIHNGESEYFSIIPTEYGDHGLDNVDYISPAFGVEECYEVYSKGVSVEKIIDKVMDLFNNCKTLYNEFDWDTLGKKDIDKRLFITLINKEKNVKLLSSVPYINFLDLAIVFNYMFTDEGDKFNSFIVTDKLVKKWEIDIQELYNIAKTNTERLFPEVLSYISTIVQELNKDVGMEAAAEYTDDDIMHVYVLTNKYAVHGSTVMLYSKKLAELADMLESDLYILPSSIHETVVVPSRYYHDTEKLKMLVKDINMDKVKATEQLSDNIYCFERESRNIYVCGYE